jgi:hypothetical protein
MRLWIEEGAEQYLLGRSAPVANKACNAEHLKREWLEIFENKVKTFWKQGEKQWGAMSFLDLEAGGVPQGRRRPQDSTQELALGVFQINTAVSSFKRLVGSLGTAKDTPALREKL